MSQYQKIYIYEALSNTCKWFYILSNPIYSYADDWDRIRGVFGGGLVQVLFLTHKFFSTRPFLSQKINTGLVLF